MSSNHQDMAGIHDGLIHVPPTAEQERAAQLVVCGSLPRDAAVEVLDALGLLRRIT